MRIPLLLAASLAGCMSSDAPGPAPVPIEAPIPAPGNESIPAHVTWPSMIHGTWQGQGGEWILVLQPLVPGNYAKDHAHGQAYRDVGPPRRSDAVRGQPHM